MNNGHYIKADVLEPLTNQASTAYRKRQTAMVAAISAASIVGLWSLMAPSPPAMETLALPQLSLDTAIKRDQTGDYYKLSPLARPSWNLYMQANAQGSIHGVNGEPKDDSHLFFFTDHPGQPGWQVITSKKYPAYFVGQRDSFIYDGYIEGYKGDPGDQAYWKVTVVKKIDQDNDVITLQTMRKPGKYAYLTMSSDPALQTMTGTPNDQAKFKRTLMSTKLQLEPSSPPKNQWAFVRTSEYVPAGRETTVEVKYSMETKTTFSTSATLDIEYLGSKAGLRTEFTASLAVATSYSKTEVIKGPSEQMSYYAQEVVIPTPKGQIIIPTDHVVAVRKYSDLNDDLFVPIGSLTGVRNQAPLSSLFEVKSESLFLQDTSVEDQKHEDIVPTLPQDVSLVINESDENQQPNLSLIELGITNNAFYQRHCARINLGAAQITAFRPGNPPINDVMACTGNNLLGWTATGRVCLNGGVRNYEYSKARVTLQRCTRQTSGAYNCAEATILTKYLTAVPTPDQNRVTPTHFDSCW